jgi:hypothetical protein
MNFRLWGTITRVGEREFFVTVTAVDDEDGQVRTVNAGEESSRVRAEDLRHQMLVRLGAKLRGEGHTVVDVEDG